MTQTIGRTTGWTPTRSIRKIDKVYYIETFFFRSATLPSLLKFVCLCLVANSIDEILPPLLRFLLVQLNCAVHTLPEVLLRVPNTVNG